MGKPSVTRVVKYIRSGTDADCHLVMAFSTSAYSDSDGNYQKNSNAIIKFDDTVILDGANRGITMYLLNASTGEVLYKYNFDTYGNSDLYSGGLIQVLGSFEDTANAVLVLVSQDAIALTDEVIEALRPYGGGSIEAVATPARAAFAFIGQSGIPTGCAYYEVRAYEKASIKLQASVANGVLVQKGADGEKGDRGPALRGPQSWSDCAVGYSFQSGADGEEYKDVVLYNGNYYSCVTSHTKTASNYPLSTLDTTNGYWKLADKFEIIATKILLATYALVENLGVEAIDMKDSDGNILFQAKDGNVTCNTGTFKNITVNNGLFSGTLMASLFYGKTKVITDTSYTIDPNNEPYNCYVIQEPTAKHYITLPKPSDFDGLELSFFIKQTNWNTSKTTYIKASGNGDMVYAKQNVYNVMSGSVIEHTLQDYNAEYTGSTAYWMMQPNILIKFKSMLGDWYCTEGLWTGE